MTQLDRKGDVRISTGSTMDSLLPILAREVGNTCGQQALCDALGKNSSTVSRWLTGQKALPVYVLTAALDLLPVASRVRVVQAMVGDTIRVLLGVSAAEPQEFHQQLLRLRREEGTFAGELLSAIADGEVTPDEAPALLDAAEGAMHAYCPIIEALRAVERREVYKIRMVS